MTSANFREIGSGLCSSVPSFHTTPRCVWNGCNTCRDPTHGRDQPVLCGLPYRYGRLVADPGDFIFGPCYLKAAALGGLFHTGYIPVPDDIKYFVLLPEGCPRRGSGVPESKARNLVDRCSAAAGPIHPPGKYLVVQACESLPDLMPNVLSLCIFGNGEQIRKHGSPHSFRPGRAVLSGDCPVGLCLFDLYHLPGGPCGEDPEKHRVHGPACPHAEPFAPTGNDGSRDPRGDGQADGRKPRCIVYHPAASAGFPPPRGAAGAGSGPFFSSVKIREQIVRTLLGATALPAFAPAACGIPRSAIVLYYLHRKDGKTDVSCQAPERYRSRPRPLWGQGWRKGGHSLKKIIIIFYRPKNTNISPQKGLIANKHQKF